MTTENDGQTVTSYSRWVVMKP